MDSIALRPLTADDVTPGYISWLNDSAIRKYLGIRHKNGMFTIQETIAFIDDCIVLKRYHWGIFYDNRHIGNVSCSAWNHNDKWIDISYMIGEKKLHGKGIATVAVGAAMTYLFKAKGMHRIQAECAVENTSSLKVMEKLGMKKDGILRQKLFLPDENRYTDEIIYSAIKDLWEIPVPEISDVQVTSMVWEN